MAKARGQESLINRDKFNQIKKYDRQQMDEFLNGIHSKAYDAGYTAGVKSVKQTEFERQALELELVKVKGLGTTRIAEVMRIIMRFFKGAEVNE